jgi:hypothetical protein
MDHEKKFKEKLKMMHIRRSARQLELTDKGNSDSTYIEEENIWFRFKPSYMLFIAKKTSQIHTNASIKKEED